VWQTPRHGRCVVLLYIPVSVCDTREENWTAYRRPTVSVVSIMLAVFVRCP
jgi:hypothetical protein